MDVAIFPCDRVLGCGYTHIACMVSQLAWPLVCDRGNQGFGQRCRSITLQWCPRVGNIHARGITNCLSLDPQWGTYSIHVHVIPNIVAFSCNRDGGWGAYIVSQMSQFFSLSQRPRMGDIHGDADVAGFPYNIV